MNHEFLRYLLLALGVIAIINWSRHSGRWRRRHGSFRSTNRSGADLAALEARLSTVESLELRVAELENRLDFAERLIAGREAPAVSRGE